MRRATSRRQRASKIGRGTLIRWGRSLFILVALSASVLLSACIGDAAPRPTATPSETPVPTVSPTATLSPTPRPTSTPYPTVTPPPVTGRVFIQTTLACELGAYGPEVRLEYRTGVEETNDPNATITRVVVFADGTLLEDSGPLAHAIYQRQTAFSGHSLGVHVIQVRVETRGAPKPADHVRFVQCPRAADGPLAHRVS